MQVFDMIELLPGYIRYPITLLLLVGLIFPLPVAITLNVVKGMSRRDMMDCGSVVLSVSLAYPLLGYPYVWGFGLAFLVIAWWQVWETACGIWPKTKRSA